MKMHLVADFCTGFLCAFEKGEARSNDSERNQKKRGVRISKEVSRMLQDEGRQRVAIAIAIVRKKRSSGLKMKINNAICRCASLSVSVLQLALSVVC